MKFPGKKSIWTTAVVSACALSLSVPIARADTITFGASGSGGDGPESASATITTGLNLLTISLSSLIANPTAAGQEVSGIFVTLSNTPTSDSLSSASGTLIDIAGGGTVTPNGGTIDHWGTSRTGATICLETAGNCAVGGKPIDLIIGSGPYTDANPSITGRNPQIQNTGTFNLLVNGITANTTVTAVTFAFGTGPDSFLEGDPTPPPPPPPSVPEPSSLLHLGTGVLGAAGLVRRKMGTTRS
jgi:hypothetical protein